MSVDHRETDTIAPGLAAHISARELEVVGFAAKGLSNKQIARQLGLSPHTVHRHLNSVNVKLRVSSRTQAVVKLIRLGALPLESGNA